MKVVSQCNNSIFAFVLMLSSLKGGFCSANYETKPTISDFHTLPRESPTKSKIKGYLFDFDLNNNSSSHKKDKFFSVDSNIFKTYLEGVDLSIIPGQRVDDDFENWTPSLEMQQDFPTYMAGFDNYNRPLWVMEWGRFRFDKYAKSTWRVQMFHKYMRYVNYVALKSLALRSNGFGRVNQHALILDMEGLPSNFLTDRKILQLQMRHMSNYLRYVEKHISKFILLNMNSISETLLSVARPFMILVIGKMEIHGTNKALWAPQLLKTFAKDQLPEWYGGSKDFKPAYVIG